MTGVYVLGFCGHAFESYPLSLFLAIGGWSTDPACDFMVSIFLF